MSSFLLEKAVIGVSLASGFPLFFLDKDLFAARRFGWLLASTCGFVSLIFGDSILKDDPELSTLLDKVTVAAICVSAIPHFNKLISDSLWTGLATMAPLFVVIYLSTSTPVGSEAYWRLRGFLHLTIFIVPYLNHLQNDIPAEEKVAVEADKEKLGVATDDVGSKKMASGKTNKHKKK